MKRKKGVALIIVIVLILLFSAIILSVVLTSTTAYKRSTFFRDRNIAFNLAQIGIADALYKLNYRYHDPDHYYGFRPDGECLTLSDGPPNNGNTFSYRIKASEIGIFPASPNDEAIVQLFINDGTYYDTIVSTGKFRGRTVKVSANIKTTSDSTTNLKRPLADNTNWDTKGIPEAFNKHVIYATTVTETGTIVKGNIATESPKPPWPGTWTEATWVQTSILLPIPSIPMMPFEPQPTINFNGWVEFQRRDGYPKYRIDGGLWTTPLPSGVVYTPVDGTGTETFTFTTYVPPGNRKIYVRKSDLPPGSGGACFDNATVVNSVLADGNIVFKGNITLSSNALFEADVNDGTGTIIIHPNTTFNGSNLIISDYNGNGSFIINQANITINGALLTNCSLTIGTSATNLRIDASSSDMNAAIILKSDPLTPPPTTSFTLNTTPSIILGNNQTYAFLLAVNNTNLLTIDIAKNGNVDFITNPITNLEDKAVFVAYAQGSSSTINIGNAKISGLIYSYGNGNSGNITLKNTNTFINGCLVANGEVKLRSGNLTYNGDFFKSDSPNIYKGFLGGRRIYLPLNWRIVW